MRKKQLGLSERQQEVLNLLVEGYTPYSIAQKLCITESCAKLHMQTIYRKYGFSYEKGQDTKVKVIVTYLRDKYAKQYNSLLETYNRLLEEIKFTD